MSEIQWKYVFQCSYLMFYSIKMFHSFSNNQSFMLSQNSGKNLPMSLHGKCMDFPINFPHYWKMQQNRWYGESLGNWYSYFSHSVSAFFPLVLFPIRFPSYGILHHMGECLSFPINFPYHSFVPNCRRWRCGKGGSNKSTRGEIIKIS